MEILGVNINMTALLVSAVAALSATCFGLVIQLVELRASLKKSSDDAESLKIKVAELEQEKDVAVSRLNERKGNASKQRPQSAESDYPMFGE